MSSSPTIRTARLAFLDFETTGLDPDAGIAQVAVVHLDPGQLPRLAFQSLVNPGREMTRGAAKVTGLTDEQLAAAPPWSEVWPAVRAALNGRVPAAFNVPADFGWGRYNCHQDELAGWPDWDAWLDPLVFVKQVDKYKPEKTLRAACERRQIAVDAHGAAGDAIATALLWPLVLEGFIARGYDEPVEDFLAEQHRLALEQEAEFCDFVARKHGTGNDRPGCPWHDLHGFTGPDWPTPAPKVGRCVLCKVSGVVYRVSRAGEVEVREAEGEAIHCCPRPTTAEQVQAGEPDVGRSAAEPSEMPYQDEDIPF